MGIEESVETAVERVLAQVRRLHRAREEVAAAQTALQREALSVLVAGDGDVEYERELVRALYWRVPDLPVRTLEAIAGTATRVRQLAAPGPLLGECEECGEELRATSRSGLAHPSKHCPPCTRKLREKERQAAYERSTRAALYEDEWPWDGHDGFFDGWPLGPVGSDEDLGWSDGDAIPPPEPPAQQMAEPPAPSMPEPPA